MLGLIVLVLFLVTMAFVLAWIHNIVAREELSIGTSFGVLLLTGIVGFGADIAVTQGLGLDVLSSAFVGLAIDVLLLASLLRLIAKTEWRPSFIIAGIYAALALAVGLGIAFLLAPAASG